MANTFKVVTKAGVSTSDIIYTVAGSKTTIILGLVIGNTTGSQVTTTVTLNTTTANRANCVTHLITTTSRHRGTLCETACSVLDFSSADDCIGFLFA